MKCLSIVSIAAASLLVLAASTSQATIGTETPDKGITAKDLNLRNFERSTRIDNKWLPLKPGTQFVYTGATSEGRRRVPHRDVFTVTDLTKTIAGVRTIVVWDRDYSAGELVETELAFFAQDKDGNIWHLGQYPEEYEHGKFVAAPAWLHGLKGARAGIFVKAKPRLRAPAYSQGFAPPPINWTDHAKAYKLGQRTCVPAGCYENVLVTAEFNPDEPGKYQLKYYAPGVGNVRVGWLGAKDTDKETLVLVKVVRLSGEDLASVRRQALKLERRAYGISKDVYARTSPARRLARELP
jgi:hypothetical protein